MSFITIRRTLFQIHMWIGLVLGLLLAALGLSGSVLVYDDKLADFLMPRPQATAQGTMLSLDAIIAAARAAVPGRGQVQVSPPQEPGSAASVRIGEMSRMGPVAQAGERRDDGRREGERREARQAAGDGPGRPNATEVLVDPVSGKVLATRKALLPPILAFAHQLHGNFLMGREGRAYVGWLGIAMLLLGVSGLVLWWPRRGQWKYAFIVRRTARGLRFHRELHGMLGIWAFIVFMAVSFSGVVLAWPVMTGSATPPGGGPRAAVTVEPVEDGQRIGADQAAALALAALPGAELRSITLPARRNQAVSVNLLSHGAIAATVIIDPWRAKVLSVRDPSEDFWAWQRPVHQGTLGTVWKFLVFLVGFLPAAFVTTGIVMWAKKRKAHIPMGAPLIDTPLPEGGA
jgi:uncharacterized iron-regulated membrane protein